MGYAFGSKGLSHVSTPVDLWRAADDHILPNPYYAEAVRTALPRPPSYHVVQGADHFDFLAPCTPAMAEAAPAICISAPGFDRAAFHGTFNIMVVSFFTGALARWGPSHTVKAHKP